MAKSEKPGKTRKTASRKKPTGQKPRKTAGKKAGKPDLKVVRSGGQGLRGLLARLRRWVLRGVLLFAVFCLAAITAYAIFNPTRTPYMMSEASRLGQIDHLWVPMEHIAPVMARSVVAAEDANFCLHWGIDVNAVRDALQGGGQRGGSTISQQVVKNVYLWHGRSYLRKGLEAVATPLVEAIWGKRRVLEVYLNVAEFDEGVFGIEAASQHYFGVAPVDLSPLQAARLAAVLPSPKKRSASKPTAFVKRRTRAIRDGAATIRADGRASCFEAG